MIDFHSFSFRFPSAETSIFVLLFISKCKENSKQVISQILKGFLFCQCTKKFTKRKTKFLSPKLASLFFISRKLLKVSCIFLNDSSLVNRKFKSLIIKIIQMNNLNDINSNTLHRITQIAERVVRRLSFFQFKYYSVVLKCQIALLLEI